MGAIPGQEWYIQRIEGLESGDIQPDETRAGMESGIHGRDGELFCIFKYFLCKINAFMRKYVAVSFQLTQNSPCDYHFLPFLKFDGVAKSRGPGIYLWRFQGVTA
jgi:hypothetical protein